MSVNAFKEIATLRSLLVFEGYVLGQLLEKMDKHPKDYGTDEECNGKKEILCQRMANMVADVTRLEETVENGMLRWINDEFTKSQTAKDVEEKNKNLAG